MGTERLYRREDRDVSELELDDDRPTPGKFTLLDRPARSGLVPGRATNPVQFYAGVGLQDPDAVHEHAQAGVSGGGGALPHWEAIQRAFGHHDIRGIRAHVGGAAASAASAIGARAYATGDDVAFSAAPDVRQAAHEAAHVVQQRGGVRLDGGVGRAGDPYEQHADAVAELVVRGANAESLLDTLAHRGAAGGPAVQREDRDGDHIDDDLVASTGAAEPADALVALLRAATPEQRHVTAAAFTPEAMRAVRPAAIYRFTLAHAIHHVRGRDVAAVAAEAQRPVTGGDAPPAEAAYEPRELPSQAARTMRQALLAGIPADKRHGDGRTILDVLPAIANILDTTITAAANRAQIVDPASAWHPQSFSGIAAPYSYALWDYFKARWESEDRATRRQHLTAAQGHWHDLLMPRIFGRIVTGDAAAVRTAIHTLIDTPARQLQSSTVFDVLTHDGRELTPAEVEAARVRRAAAVSRPRGGGITRSETVDVAAGDVTVTPGEPRTVRYINPDAIHYVPHRPNLTPNPRHAAFDDLAASLNRLEAARGDAAATTTADADVTTQVATARERMLIYVRHNAENPADLAAAEAAIPALPITVDVQVREYDVDVGLYRVHLSPVAPGALIERPGGFTARTTERSSGRSVTGAPTEDTITAAIGGLTGDQATMARLWVTVERSGEGSVTSLNTWDRTCITLGSGVSGAGPLQSQFLMFHDADPAAYERLFGRHGIGVDREQTGGRRGRHSGAAEFTTPDGLSGRPALEHMADDPATLAVMVTAGIDPAWQQSLITGLVNSLRRAFTVGFTVGEGTHVTIAEGGGATNVYEWLEGHVPSNLLTCVMFAFACDFHGSSHLQRALTRGFAPHYNTALAEPADRTHPEAASDAARAQIATWIATDCSHPQRRRLIAQAMGASSYSALTGGE
ncbi:MAG TPA: DUF4157 domain-containing protein [Kofleriaceae bacterium]|jgi:hypothetical protein